MPVIAVVGAIGATVIAGVDIAAVGLTAITALEVVAAVGATVAAVGVVTRDKTLTMVGGAIGMVGAIGGIAASAGLLGAEVASGAPLFGAAPDAATFASGGASDIAGQVGGAIDSGTWDMGAGLSAADAASADTIPFVANGMSEGQSSLTTLSSVAEKASDPATALGTAPTNAIDPAKDLASMTDPAKGLINQPSGTDLIQPPTAPPNGLGTADPTTGTNVTSAVDPATGKIVDMPGESSGVFGDILKFANNNKTLVSGALTVGGKLLEGAFSTVTPAQVTALNAQAAANQAAADLTNQQRANLAMPKSVASSAPVTGTPQAIIPPRGAPGGPGIINQPRPAPVTGAVV